jgi:hypothetical protein
MQAMDIQKAVLDIISAELSTGSAPTATHGEMTKRQAHMQPLQPSLHEPVLTLTATSGSGTEI